MLPISHLKIIEEKYLIQKEKKEEEKKNVEIVLSQR